MSKIFLNRESIAPVRRFSIRIDVLLLTVLCKFFFNEFFKEFYENSIKFLLQYEFDRFFCTFRLYPSKLWEKLTSVADIIETAYRWRLTLEKNGCGRLLEGAGADGMIQAMILSFGGFQFTHHHLEFGTEPKDLHRDYDFRNLAFGNGSFVSIKVEVNKENKAVLYASVNRTIINDSNRHFFACDAGCLDVPVELGADWKQFPVKLTDPLTPILYITADKEHMEELKHTIHVKEVAEGIIIIDINYKYKSTVLYI